MAKPLRVRQWHQERIHATAESSKEASEGGTISLTSAQSFTLQILLATITINQSINSLALLIYTFHSYSLSYFPVSTGLQLSMQFHRSSQCGLLLSPSFVSSFDLM
jgi:hypothetical protein